MTAGRRLLLLCICLPLATAVTGVLAYQYSIHLSNRALVSRNLPQASSVKPGNSIIIFAPHCDDETIATGGLINTAKKDGADVKVVLLTNGDGFNLAADLQYHKVHLRPQKYIDFAESRQKDTAQAVFTMGLSKDDLIFLGYPDRGLMQMWSANWTDHFRSKCTKLTYSPYENSYRKRAVYCGQSVLNDIRSILLDQKPTDIYVCHPSDDHSDHAATYAFVTTALESARARSSDLAKTSVHTYLVHRGEWPTPMAYKPKAVLQPPFAMANLDTTWDALPLTPEVVALKKQAILCHKSQVRLMKGYLLSFARRNEMFGDLPNGHIRSVRDGRIEIDGRETDWAGIAPCERDPVADKLLRGIQKAGDVKQLYLCTDSANVYVRAEFRRNLSKRVAYNVRIRTFGRTGRKETTRLWTATVKPPSQCDPPGTYFAWKDTTLELMIPREKLGPTETLFLCVDTSAMRLKIDSTGWRGYEFPGHQTRT